MKTLLDNADELYEFVHVMPAYGPEHDLDHGDECWCEPNVEVQEDGTWLVLHRDMN